MSIFKPTLFESLIGSDGKPNTHPDYKKLPESIKMSVSEKEYCWLSDEEKRNLENEFCMPDVDLGE